MIVCVCAWSPWSPAWRTVAVVGVGVVQAALLLRPLLRQSVDPGEGQRLGRAARPPPRGSSNWEGEGQSWENLVESSKAFNKTTQMVVGEIEHIIR